MNTQQFLSSVQKILLLDRHFNSDFPISDYLRYKTISILSSPFSLQPDRISHSINDTIVLEFRGRKNNWYSIIEIYGEEENNSPSEPGIVIGFSKRDGKPDGRNVYFPEIFEEAFWNQIYSFLEGNY